jgi:plasmid stability protein
MLENRRLRRAPALHVRAGGMDPLDPRILLADLIADVEAHGRSLEALKRELLRLQLTGQTVAGLDLRERALESDYQRIRQRAFALKARLPLVLPAARDDG